MKVTYGGLKSHEAQVCVQRRKSQRLLLEAAPKLRLDLTS